MPTTYRDLLRRADIRRLIVVGMVSRIPHAAAGLVLTFHIVETLGRSYGQAGAVVAAYTIGIGIGAPWRGRRIDRVGLRPALVPSIAVQAVVWPLVGLLPYLLLFPVVLLGGMFALPIFSVVRKALSVMVTPTGRRTAFALDSVCVEIVFMVAPAVGAWLAMEVGSTPVLVGIGIATVASGSLLWWFDPPMDSARAGAPVEDAGPVERPDPDAETPRSPYGPPPVERVDPSREAGPVPTDHRWHGWMSADVVVVLLVSVAAAIALAGTDVGILAQVRELDATGYLGVSYAVWCASSAVGGLLYGAQHRSISPIVLVLILGVATVPLILVTSTTSLLVLLVVAGFACAPVMAATADTLARLVPEARRGEAMGWQGSAFTAGSALGSPIAGLAIDRFGAAGGFGAVALIAVLVAVVGAIVHRAVRRDGS